MLNNLQYAMVQSYLSNGGNVHNVGVNTDLVLRGQLDDSYATYSSIQYLELSSNSLQTFSFGSAYQCNSLQAELVADTTGTKRNLQCTRDTAGPNACPASYCQELGTSPGENALLTKARFKPQTGYAAAHASGYNWFRNGFILTGSFYQVLLPAGYCGLYESACMYPPPSPPTNHHSNEQCALMLVNEW